jgi:hypothetical protein
MPRIPLVKPEAATPEQKALWDETAAAHGVVTNMKATLLHSRVALRAVLAWYDLFDEARKFLSEREAILFSSAISRANRRTLCSLFMRRAIVEWGEEPDRLVLDERARALVDFGRQLVVDANNVSDGLFGRLKGHFNDAEIVELTAFGGLMIVNNLFNDALKVDIDASLESHRVSPEVLFG